MRLDSQAFADVAVTAVKSATVPLLERLAAQDQRIADLSARLQDFAGVRDRLTVVETKSAAVLPEQPDLSPLLERLAVAEQIVKELQAKVSEALSVRDRVVAMEVKSAQPIPQPEPTDLSPVLHSLSTLNDRLTALEATKDAPVTLAAIREELKALQPRQDAPAPVSDDLRDRIKSLESSTDVDVLTKQVSDTRDKFIALEKATIERYGEIKERVAVLEARPQVPGPQGPTGEPGPPGKDGRDGDAQLPYLGVYQEGKEYTAGQMATWGGSMWHCNALTTSKPGEGSKDWTLMVKRGRDGRDGKDAMTLPVVGLK